MMNLYQVSIQVKRQATGKNGKEAALAVLKDLEINLKFLTCPGIKTKRVKGEQV